MSAELWLQIEVTGCPTVCRHCWAQGISYSAMPVNDVAWVLEQVHRFCDARRLSFGAYPMHELAAHPHAAELLRLFADHVGAAEFEPLATTGVPLAVREDWRELLAAAAELGTTTVWMAFHGIGIEHDRQVNRTGAFTETCLAVQRVHAAGLRAGTNVFLTTANTPDAERLLGVLQRLQIDGMAWEPAMYYPTPRGRHNERLRPELSDLLPFADRIYQAGSLNGEVWADLAGHTEAAWVSRALAGDWPTRARHDAEVLGLVCRPNLDLHTGVAGWHLERHGNLRTDDPSAILGSALQEGGRTFDALLFGSDPLPSAAELAARHGDRHGRGVHFSPDSARYLWLDRARQA